MAIKISGTTVIDDSRDINNIGIVTANIIHLKGGTFGPIDGGTDTKADTAIVVGENFHIYNLESSGGHLRNLIEKSNGDITIGHADTATIDKISLIPGKGTGGTVTELWAGNASESVGILTANQSGVTVSGILTATTFDAPSYHMASILTRDKYRFWGNTQWTMGMTNGMTFGGLNSYAITSQVTNHDDRGWVFLDTNHTDAQGVMSLNTIGELVVAKSIRAGGGESDTSAPRQPLDIIGDGIISGDVGIGTTNPTGTAALTNNTKKLAVGVVTTTSVYGKLNNLTYPTVDGTDGYVLTSDGSGVVQWEAAPGAGGGDANQDAFSNVAVAGQTTVAADSATDTLTLVAGTNVTITTDDSADSVTINASGGGGGISMGKAIAAAMVFG